MKARFRVRLRDGEELTIRSLEGLFERVASGIVGRQDLIHDALTGEWAPAGRLPVYWLCTDLLAHGVPPGGEAGLPRPPVAVPDSLFRGHPSGEAEDDGMVSTEGEVSTASSEVREVEVGGGGLSLAEATPGRSPEEEKVAFIARMEDERAADEEAPALNELGSLGGEPFVGSAPRRETKSDGLSLEPGPLREVSRPAVRPLKTRRAQPDQLIMAMAVVLGLAGVGGVLGLAWPGLGGDVTAPVAEASAGRVARAVAPTEAELRTAAYDDFLLAVERLALDLGVGPVPEMWLEGLYLADAGSYPEVERYWIRYGDFVAETRAREADLFRAAYLAQAEAAGFAGPVRSLRLATAVADFAQGRGHREVAYARVRELVDAALDLHTLSARAAGRISYEPARANRVSADPVIEATGTDEEMQAALDAGLDRVLVALHGEVEGEGPGRDGVEGWLMEALRHEAPATSR